MIFSVLFSIFCHVSSGLPSFGSISTDIYIGVENPIKIILNGCNPEEILLKVNVGTLQKRSDSVYVYFPQGISEEIKFKLYYKKILCEVKSASSKILPEPTLVFEKENQGILNVKDLLNPGKLQFIYPSMYPENNKNKILSFAIIANDHSGNPAFSTTIRGDALDEKTLTQLNKLKSGSVISLNNILVSNIYKGNSRYPLNKEITIRD